MKFFRHFENRLMNEAGEADGGGGSAVDFGDSTSGESDYNNFEIGSDTDALKAYGLDPNKYGLDQKDQSEAPGEESQGSDKSQAAGQETDENAWLEKVNSIGAIHNDNPIKVESIEQLKEFLQKGQDYTLKTQSLSEERKAWEAERSSAEQEINSAIEEFNNSQKEYGEKLHELEQWVFTLKELAENSPDIHEEVSRAFERTKKQFSNPILDQQLAAVRAESAAIRAELAETKKGLTQREDKLIVDSFETEFAKLSATEQSLKELGISVNKDEVKKKWAATGLSPEEVIGLMYGPKMMQAQASKAKVETVKNKVQAKSVGIGNKSRPGSKQPVIDPKLKGFERAMALYKQLQG